MFHAGRVLKALQRKSHRLVSGFSDDCSWARTAMPCWTSLSSHFPALPLCCHMTLKLHRSRTGCFELRPVTGFSTSVPSVHLQFPSTPGVRPCQLPGPLWMSLVGESSPEYLLSNECCHSAACQSSCHESLEGNLKSGLFWLTLLGVHRLGSDGFCLFDYQ